MPVFGFLGNRPRRSGAAIVRREQRFCERKGKTSLKGKGRQGSGGKSSWGEARGGKGKGNMAFTAPWNPRSTVFVGKFRKKVP